MRRSIRLFVLAVVVLYAGLVFCGPVPDDSSAHTETSVVLQLKDDGLTLLRAAAYALSSPVRWDGTDWSRAAAIGGATTVSYVLDTDMRDFMLHNQTGFNDGINHVAEPYGSGLNMLVLAAGGYLAGLAIHDTWIRETSLLAGTAMLIAGTISTVIKVSVGRARPYLNEGHHSFRPFSFPTEDYASFPSGHTIVAFAFSAVLAERIDNVWASIGLYSLAGATAFARMYSDHHWFSDVVFSAGVSIAVGKSVVRWYAGNRKDSSAAGFSVAPTANGIVVLWTF